MTQRESYEVGEAHSDSARCHSDPILFFLSGSDSEGVLHGCDRSKSLYLDEGCVGAKVFEQNSITLLALGM